MSVFIETLGGLRVFHNNSEVKLPPSKRTRALLAYLALSGRPYRRESLCETFWEFPDDPRGSLRWSLSKIRPLVNTHGQTRLMADRERVSLAVSGLKVDVHVIKDLIEKPGQSVSELTALAGRLREPLLQGLELSDQDCYQLWLRSERRETERLLARVCARLIGHAECAVDEQLEWARLWHDLAPLDPKAATALVTLLDRMGCVQELVRVQGELERRFSRASIRWSADARTNVASEIEVLAPSPTAKPSGDEMLRRQKIQFCEADHKVRIAYASLGEGPPIVKAANWLTHLEHDWEAPIWSPLFRDLAADHQFLRYDERGNGLSDWHVDDISFEAFVTDLEAVVDASGLEQFALLGISQGAAVSIEYAVRHPEKVKCLILFGGYAEGWRIGASKEEVEEREAVIALTKLGWGRDNPAYRQIFSSTFMPSANAEELDWFNRFQRLTTSPANAAQFLEVFSNINVRERLSKIQAPTLVMHSLRDQRIAAEVGRDLAASIPSAEFVGLDSDGHLLLGREKASEEFVRAIRDFMARC